MSTVEDIFLKWVFPLLGGIVGTMMFMAPLKAVLQVRRDRDLGVRPCTYVYVLLSVVCLSVFIDGDMAYCERVYKLL